MNQIDTMYSGFMSLKREKNDLGSFFFWLAKKRENNIPDNKKLVIWLNGGPGCSSMVGMMWENGPFTIHFGGNNIKSFLLFFYYQ
jgi:carboxypeptidase C (cathepsin A)